MPDNIVIGAGVAGACVAYNLRQQGQEVLVLDQEGTGAGASGNQAAALYPLFTAAPSPMGNFYLEAYKYALDFYKSERSFIQSPVVCLPKNEKNINRFQKIHHMDMYQAYLEKSEQLLIFHKGGIIKPKPLLKHLLTGIEVRIETVKQISSSEVNDHSFKNLYICNGWQAAQFVDWLQMTPVRGQVTLLEGNCNFKEVRCKDGYVLPLTTTQGLAGSTYTRHNTRCDIKQDDDCANIERWSDLTGDLKPEIIESRASIRGRSRDTLPYCGKITDNIHVLAGLGSRGFTTAPYCAAYLTNRINVPLEVQRTIAPQRLKRP